MSNQQRVFVLDSNKQPLMPCHPARCRELLREGKAAVFRRYPFTIILKDRVGGDVQPLQIKIDPGSKTTGIALVLEGKRSKKVVWGAELTHRGQKITIDLQSRSQSRGSRRARKLRYRPARFLNRTKTKGWLAPSLMHRIQTTDTWVTRLARFTPADQISQELVRFDLQKLENPEVSGIEYQQGKLVGYEIREYLLEKFNRTCVYCGVKDVPLQIEHVIPKSRGGTNRISNLTLACCSCNQKKGSDTVEQFLAKKPELLKKILGQLKAPLKDAAAVNATRWRLRETLQAFGFPLELGSGGLTKKNRVSQGFRKEHWIDAACVGKSGSHIKIPDLQPLQIKSMGHGTRRSCTTDKYGFPKTHRTRVKTFFGFRTGDMVKAVVTTGKKIGTYVDRITVRKTGKFKIGKVDGLHYRFFSLVQRGDGYGYLF